jgi:hypothetical protein
MITTVTTTTVTTVTTITAASLALFAVLTLLVLLVNKELISSSASQKAMQFSKALNVAVVPLLLVFVMTVGMKLVDALGK